MASWREALRKTRRTVRRGLGTLFGGGRPSEEAVEELEENLLAADLPARLAMELVETAEASGGDGLREGIERRLIEELGPAAPVSWAEAPRPMTVLLVGANGSGKTTTAAKLARRAAGNGRKPLLCAADTFRAAGTEQLALWAERVGCDVVRGQRGSDAAAVAYDAQQAALARGADTLLVDTAGRMHTREPLMRELGKISRALEKGREHAPEETWIVLDASIGQNAVAQAKFFHQAVPLTGAILTKLDGSAKGGAVFAVRRELGIPLLYAGLGEGEEDLAPFDPESFVRSIFEEDDEGV
ncbi:signal recognition particle-docking protein FtsY [Kiritimatiella glycovorans]|uniref:Signal recognition particle receptor FtsY n=1 Tax=Kiritimatiella glycovorans TaxID=1307763 RepID=A0A0G3EFA5_9BACT|nr:signal recognition particle-docking protein FtsY [Kiritimatiella glycovorans]AKJ65018.1 Signal recognition particle receptor FtsY [Kiritimatiella glycovorans]